MTFEQQWIEYEYNPFILFSSEGKVTSLNAEAQYLLGSVDTHAIFEIATTYASTSFGFKTTFLDLEFGRYKFFGITVGYENEESIGIKLYQLPSFKFSKPKLTADLINVYTLIDICISTSSIGSHTKYTKLIDPSIPEIRLSADLFIKLLNKTYQSFKKSDEIHTHLYYRVGEYIRFEEKKYTIFSLSINGTSHNQKLDSEIEYFAEEAGLYCEIKTDKITINVPIIS